MGSAAAFTAAQWEELGRQAVIYKHLAAGVPVPPDLLLPLRPSSAAAPLYYHPTLGYLSYYGKKLDPEPGRCRRTDGKKWRCSKDAHPDSKYCERHMHRSRNRSRKPVETKIISQSQSSSSTVTSCPPAGGIGSRNGSLGSNSLQHSFVGGSYPQGLCSSTASASQWQLDPGSYGLASKEYRRLCKCDPTCSCLHGAKAEADEHGFFKETSGGTKGVGMDSSVDSSWRLMPSEVSSFTLSKARTNSLPQSNYPQLQLVQDLGQPTLSTSTKEQQQLPFLGGEFGLSEPVKHESQPLRPFFDEWPRTRDLWDLDNERSNPSAFSTTQLSISTPIVSSDFSTSDSRPTHGVPLF